MWSESSKDQITASSGRYKKGSSNISISTSSPKFSLPKCKQWQSKLQDTWHKINKKKNKWDLLSKKKILEKDGDVFDTLGCLPGELNLEEDKSIQPVKLCATGD